MNDAFSKFVVLVLLLLPITIFSCQNKKQQKRSEAETNFFHYSEYQPLASQPIKVWYFLPESIQEDTPILMLMHGNGRNAEGYRDAMIGPATRHNFILVVPEFSKEHYPESRDYHEGGIFDVNNEIKPEEYWTFSLIEPLFDEVKKRFGNSSENYLMYGFSAGSQFVHRFMYAKPDNRASKTITASAGRYTMPDLEIEYPYGLANIDISNESLKMFYNRKFIVAVGDADTILSREDLTKNKLANAQGRDRVERAHTFYNESKQVAQKLNTPFNWEIVEIPHLGHKQSDMAEPIAEILFDE